MTFKKSFASVTLATCMATLVALPVTVLAHDHQSGESAAMHGSSITLGDLEISNGFARATLPTAPVGGGFVTIVNNGKEDDTLISATSDVAGDVQLHNMRVENDVMKMYEMEGGIPLPAGETITLAPGGLHIMFMKLNQQLVEGSKVKVTLTFEKAGSTDVMLDVRTVGAKGKMKGMDHSAHGAKDAHGHHGAMVDKSSMSSDEAAKPEPTRTDANLISAH